MPKYSYQHIYRYVAGIGIVRTAISYAGIIIIIYLSGKSFSLLALVGIYKTLINIAVHY